MNTYYVGGAFVAEDEAAISVNDLSILRGYGVFDFLRSYSGIPFHLDDHLDRFMRSARLLNLKMDYSKDELKDIILETIQKNNHKEFNVRMIFTGGVSHDGYTPDNQSQLLIMVTEAKTISEHCYSHGVKVITASAQRVVPSAKTTNYIPAILSMKEARDQGAIEAIYTDEQGFLLEGTTSNLFCVINGTLVTSPDHLILPGITRQVVLSLLDDSIPFQIRPIHRDEIPLISEAFLTASNKEVMPVNAINSYEIPGSTSPGITQEIMEKFRKYTENFTH